MGLSGRKVKQRIPADPRNLSWANDANKFGAAYMQKLGWDPSAGLGPSGAGRTTHIAVHQKLDMLGIGADHRNSQDGTAWKQNKDFEALLQRLNAQTGPAAADPAPVMKVDGFVRPQAEQDGEDALESVESDGQEKKRKRKKRTVEEGEDERKERKKRKKAKDTDKGSSSESERRRAKEEKKKRKREAAAESEIVPVALDIPETAPRVVVPRPMRAHRARHIASKGLASKSASAIAEILGVAPSSLSTPSSVSTPDLSASLTPADETVLQPITTSSKSVMDYFREKLAAKSAQGSGSATPAAEDGDEQAPRIGSGVARMRATDEEERPRVGIGATRAFVAAQADPNVPTQAQASASPTKEQSEKKRKKDRKDTQKAPLDDVVEAVDAVKDKIPKIRKEKIENTRSDSSLPIEREDTNQGKSKKKKRNKHS